MIELVVAGLSHREEDAAATLVVTAVANRDRDMGELICEMQFLGQDGDETTLQKPIVSWKRFV